VIGNTAIPVVKLKTHMLSRMAVDGVSHYYDDGNNQGQGQGQGQGQTQGQGLIERSNYAKSGVDSNSSLLPTNITDATNINLDGNSNFNTGRPRGSARGSVLSLDISFEGPGHYGLEANKMTTSLIKVLGLLFQLYSSSSWHFHSKSCEKTVVSFIRFLCQFSPKLLSVSMESFSRSTSRNSSTLF
jgi:hypothetical protein